MRKLLACLISVLLACSPAWAAIGTDTVWEFRADATAAMVNGGGFNPSNATPGTDYSQQAAAQDNGTDLACADGDAAAPVITSATHNFVDADEGNIIHITAGVNWTAGWYEIVSTAANAATLDRACGADGALSDGTWYLGGALSLNSTLDDDFLEQCEPGNKIWFKAGTYQIGESIAVSKVGTTANIIVIEGYNATRGDSPTGTNRPLIDDRTVNSNFNIVLGSHWHIYNFRFLGVTSTNITAGAFGVIRNCSSISSRATAGTGIALGLASAAINCDAKGNTSSGGIGFSTSTGSSLIGCYAYDSVTNIVVNGDYGRIVDSWSVGGTESISFLASTIEHVLVVNNVVYGAAVSSGTGINLNGSQGNVVLNNIFYGLTTGITTTAADEGNYINYNLFYNNTANSSNVTLLSNNITGQDPLFNAPGSLDFTLRAGSPALGVGFPSTVNNSIVGDYNINIGVDQGDHVVCGGHLVNT